MIDIMIIVLIMFDTIMIMIFNYGIREPQREDICAKTIFRVYR